MRLELLVQVTDTSRQTIDTDVGTDRLQHGNQFRCGALAALIAIQRHQNVAPLELVKPLRLPVDVSNTEVPIDASVLGSWLMIPAKIMRLIPLPIPCSVISSPSHIRRSEPAVIAVTATVHSIIVVSPSAVVLPASTD